MDKRNLKKKGKGKRKKGREGKEGEENALLNGNSWNRKCIACLAKLKKCHLTSILRERDGVQAYAT